MDDLTHTLRVLCQRNRDGSYATQADRLRTLTLASRQLKQAGFRRMRASSLKNKHVEVLLGRWQADGLSAGTLKNRLAHLRWWAEKVGRAGIMPADNAQLAIPNRRLVTNENRSRHLGDNLERVSDPHVRMSLELQQQFGLRREECIKFQPRYADRRDHKDSERAKWLRNPLYTGRVRWNAGGYVRNPDTAKRVWRARPQDEWVEHCDEALRIVSDELFQRAQQRNRIQPMNYARLWISRNTNAGS
ncbi:MAG TPA: phage integrase N-terminal domain-containing protein [Steroidobacteraceae bacterium]|nr:phage integrase N-terminal domain-containing protein [Steroidobacteraceae bacterium]